MHVRLDAAARGRARRPDAPAGAPPAIGLSNAALARWSQGVAAPAAPTRPPTAAPLPQRPALPERGANPADLLPPVTARHIRGRSASDAALRRQAQGWARDAIAAIRAGAAASGAPHAAEIAEHEAVELQGDVDALLDGLRSSGERPATRLAIFAGHLRELVARKTREVELEFHHNVIVETGSLGYGYGLFGEGELDLERLDTALTGMPVEATWRSPRVVRFKREMFAGGSIGTGGETDFATGRITLYDTGMAADPFRRSEALGLPGYMQTIRHELGHLLEYRLSSADKQELFVTIMGWHEYPWAWITASPPPYPTWRAERDRLKAETGLGDAELDRWLGTFTLGALDRSAAQLRGNRTYIRSRGAGDKLHSILAAETPSGPEFEYALTNKGDYLAELYAFATSRPEWLAGKLTPVQRRWWREKVFGLPGSDRDVGRLVALAHAHAVAPDPAGILTWEQIDRVLARLQPAGAA